MGNLRGVARGEPPPIDALIDEAQLAERQGRREQARALYERALYRLAHPSEGPRASALLRWIGCTYQVDADLEAALDCLEAALAVAEAFGDQASVGHAINLQAIVHWQQGQLDEAERLYLKARESALRSGERKLAAMTAQNLGVVANVRGDLDKALGHYERSLADYRALGLPKDVAVALNNMGKLYTALQRWEAAERAYAEAVQISTALGDLSTRMVHEVNLAELWIAQGAFDQAREACDRAMGLAHQTRDTRAHGEANKIYGIIARETGDYALADEHLARAERIAAERQDLLLAAETAREMAELYGRQGRNREMMQCLNRAHRLFSQLSARRDLADVDRRMSRLESDFLRVVRHWGDSIESKDRYTQGHCERVADLACAVAAETGMDSKSLFWFRIGALLHDVGKLVIPSEVLNKVGRPTEEEWALIKRHPVAGVEMLAEIDFPWDVRPIVESHHERWDGSGYPHGLAGEDIPFTARILCIADVYDALTSERSYKKALAPAEAMEVMRRDVGRQFDPALFRHFERVMATRPVASLAAATPATPDGARPGPGKLPSGIQVDELTGVPLRRAFLETATRVLAESREIQRPVSLAIIDVDNFKLVNDTFGHLQGDDVLRMVAEVLRQSTRPGDFVCRYAGDEFVVLLPNALPDEAREIAERLRSAVHRQQCARRDAVTGSVSVTLSIGVATAPQHGDSLETLFQAADRALYDAKRQGRNAVALAASTDAATRTPQLNVERFIGRVDELRQLVRLLDASAHGEPQVVAILGEAGVGKSTLLRQLGPEVRLRAGSLVGGRCLEGDVRPPYGPWADVINAIADLGVVPGRSWRELPRLVPALADGVGSTAGSETGNKYVLFEEIAEYLRLAAAACPLVIVLDDMQWADSATWDTLEHLLPQLDRDRLLICLTIRAEDALGAADRRRRLSRDERFHELRLQRLTSAELQQWMEAVFRQREPSAHLLGFVYRHTEGNPFLVVQLLRTLLEEGAVQYTGERWEWRPVSELRMPVAASDLLARRLERLSPKARNILATAAVIGRVFDIDLAIAAGAGSEDELLDAIDEGTAAAVLEPVANGDGDRFAFTHGLLADAVRRATNARRLKRIHLRVAQAMEVRCPTAVAEIAAHFDSAGDSGQTYRYAVLAGARAASVYAHDEATAFFSMAQRHAGTPSRIAEARLRLAQVAEAAGRYAEAEELCDLVLGCGADEADQARTLSVRRMRERLRALQGQPPQQTLEACRLLLAEAEAAALEGERVALMTMISQAHTRLGDWAAAEQLARECVRMAESMGDPRLLADALTRLGTTLLETRPEEVIVLYRRALDLFVELDERYGQVRCHINTGIAYSRAGNGPAAEEAYVTALTLGRGAHALDLAGLASLNLGVLHLKTGCYDQARARFEEALRLFTTVQNTPHRLGTLYNMAHLARECGDSASALDLYEQTASLASNIGQTDVEIGARAGMGLAGLGLARHSIAKRGLQSAVALMGERDGWWFQGRELVEALRVRVSLEEGDVPLAVRQFHTALSLAERHDLYGTAWLVAECATPLAAAGLSEVWDVVARYGPLVDALGYVPLSSRYASLTWEEGAGNRK